MSKNELERIVLETLERIEREGQGRHENQDEKILRLESRVNDYELHLTRLSELFRRLESPVENLNSILKSGGR